MKSELVKDKSYIEFLSDLKKKIHLAQVKAALAVNAQMVFLYWEIGNSILRKQENEGWGAKVIERLSHDLRNAFPEIKGLSSRNLNYMRKFAETYPDFEFVQQLAAQIPWFHNCVLIDKVKSKKERECYIQQTIQNGCSRNVLIHCKTKNRIIAEYALRDMSKPIGVSEYKFTEAIPEELKSSLPTIEELEAELMVN